MTLVLTAGRRFQALEAASAFNIRISPHIPAYPRISAITEGPLVACVNRIREPNLKATQPNEPLDRTQEVGGSNPPSSIGFPCKYVVFGGTVRSCPGK